MKTKDTNTKLLKFIFALLEKAIDGISGRNGAIGNGGLVSPLAHFVIESFLTEFTTLATAFIFIPRLFNTPPLAALVSSGFAFCLSLISHRKALALSNFKEKFLTYSDISYLWNSVPTKDEKSLFIMKI